MPKLFLEGLSQDEYAAMQQIYQLAFERARQQIQRDGGDPYAGFGDGGGI